MVQAIPVQWLLLIGAIHILTVNGYDCINTARTGWTEENTTCPTGYNEVYRDEDTHYPHQYLRWCCLPGSVGETAKKRSAPNCRATQCLASNVNQLCSTLDDRYINGKKLEYEEVMRPTCKRGGNGGQGNMGLCCQPNSQEGMLVTTLGTELNEFPHQAKISVGCGGTVYNSQYIITAAHCVVHGGILMDAKKVTVILGTNIGDKEAVPEDYKYEVRKIIPHEKYSLWAENPKNELVFQRYYNDIALLELEKKIEFSDHVKSLEIAPANFDPFLYADNAVIVGWGTTQTLAEAIHLKKANFILRRDERCFDWGEKWDFFADKKNSLMCVGGIMDGKVSWSAGKGDSGGPAICRKANGNPVLCGVTSFGGNDEDCVKKGDAASCPPSVYTEVAFFHKWIKDNAKSQEPDQFYQPYLYGKEVAPSNHQHQVHITSANGMSCGGTLVKPNFVVTAAHCVMKADGKNVLYPDLKVTTGVNDLKTGKGSTFEVSDARFLDGFKMQVDVASQKDREIMTDNYYNNNLAVLKLEKSTSVRQVKLPRLPSHREKFYSGVELAFPRNTTRSGQMRSRDFNLLDLEECQKRMSRLSAHTGNDIKVDDNIMCGTEKYSGGSLCDRELGGGLICKDFEGKDVLCGVQIFRLCMLSIPNGFIDMSRYGSWVERAITQMS